MKKKVLFSVCFIVAATLQAQVGINNSDPKASLHITPQNTDGSTAEGIIAPNLTRAQLIGKDVRYGLDQKGAIVYVSDLSGTITTKTALVTATGYYYFDGTVWQPFTQPAPIIPTEPWQVQGSTTAASANSQNIYQTGSVGIGSMAAVPSAYMFQVTGSSNVTANSRVASSTVVGNETVGGTFAVTGAATLNNALTVAGTTTTNATNIGGLMKYTNTTPTVGQYLRASSTDGSVAWATLPVTAASNGLSMNGTTTELGGTLTKATTITGTTANTLTIAATTHIGTTAANSNLTVNGNTVVTGNQTVGGTLGVTGVTTLASTLNVAGTANLNGITNTKATNVTGLMKYTYTTPTVGQYLRASSTDGSVAWATLPVTTASNGLSMNGTTTELGGALTKATTISGTTANTLTISAPSIISGALKISSGSPGEGRVLTSDKDGNATWRNMVATPTAGTMGSTDLAMTSTYRYLQSFIKVPSGRSQVFVGCFIRNTSSNSGYATFTLSSSNEASTKANFTQNPGLAGITFTAANSSGSSSSIGQFTFFINNTSGEALTLYLWGLSTVNATWKVYGVAEPYIFVAS